MAQKYLNDDESISEINVVPLVDIILVVLIIFMVTAPMIMKPSLKVDLPKGQSGDKTKASPFQVTLSSSGGLFLNGKLINLKMLAERAKEELSKNPDLQAVISADKEVPHGTVVETLDTVKTAGISKFAISIDEAPKK